MAIRSKRHPLTELKAAVSRAFDLALGGTVDHGRASPANLEAVAARSASLSWENCASLLLLMSVKLLAHAKQQVGFRLARSGALASGDESPRASDLKAATRTLYRRLTEFCPRQILNALPEPAQLTGDRLLRIWHELERAQLADQLDECSLGYAYQMLAAPLRRASQAEIQKANKALTVSQLIAFTQLYTPAWVADFLIENTLLPQWSGCKPSHASQTGAEPPGHYLLNGPDSSSVMAASELRLIDPACGAGHFLLRAFDLLVRLQVQEGASVTDAARRVLEHNIAGTDIDAAALWVAALALLVKSIKAGVEHQINCPRLACVGPDQMKGGTHPLLGSLDQSWQSVDGHPLSQLYHAVVTNPPYIGRKLLPRDLKAELKRLYPDAHQDLCAAFIERGLQLLQPGGRLGFIAQASLLHLPSYQDLRKRLAQKERLIAVVEAGTGVFPLQGGEKVNSALIVLESQQQDKGAHASFARRERAIFVDVTQAQHKDQAVRQVASEGGGLELANVYIRDPHSFRHHPRFGFAYKCPEVVLNVMRSTTPLSELADVRQGLATSDNRRFVRHWWDVDPTEIGTRWIPYVKGAGSDRWYSPVMHMVNWADDGAEIKDAVLRAYPYLKGKAGWVVKNEEFYFKEGLTFSFVNSRTLAVRRLPPGCIFDVGSSGLFASPDTLDWLLAYLNSACLAAFARLLNPTINFQVGDIKRLPVLPLSEHARGLLAQIAHECHRTKRELHAFDPTSPDTVIPKEVLDLTAGAEANEQWRAASRRLSSYARRFGELEAHADRIVLESLLSLTGSDAEARRSVQSWVEQESRPAPIPPAAASEHEFARLVVHFLIRQALEKASPDWNEPADCRSARPADEQPLLLPAAEQDLHRALGITGSSALWLSDRLGSSISSYLTRQFQVDHTRQFRGRPLYFCQAIPEAHSLLVVSGRALRRMSATGADFKGNVEKQGAQRILKDLYARLASDPERTVADIKPV
ncbi:MAG TPA: DNA methyltransferase [Candidatus Obscuribacterales bacterium]